jgi:hypothetical protein
MTAMGRKRTPEISLSYSCWIVPAFACPESSGRGSFTDSRINRDRSCHPRCTLGETRSVTLAPPSALGSDHREGHKVEEVEDLPF